MQNERASSNQTRNDENIQVDDEDEKGEEKAEKKKKIPLKSLDVDDKWYESGNGKKSSFARSSGDVSAKRCSQWITKCFCNNR